MKRKHLQAVFKISDCFKQNTQNFLQRNDFYPLNILGNTDNTITRTT